MRSRSRLLLPGLAALMAVGLGGIAGATDDDSMESMASMAPMEPGLSVRDAWARQSPMVDLAGAAYMVIHNSADVDDALIAATSTASEVVELHQSSMDEEGMMAMTPVAQIPVPALGDAILEPGGYHVMLIDLVEPLTEGDTVEISLEFLNAEPQTISLPVLAGPPMASDDMDMGDDMDQDGG